MSEEGEPAAMIGKRIKELRIDKGISLNQLAERAGVAKSYLSYIERDLQTNPSLHFLQKICEVLEVDIEALLAGSADFYEVFDQEWEELAREAVRAGVNKKHMGEYKSFVEFMEWKQKRAEQG